MYLRIERAQLDQTRGKSTLVLSPKTPQTPLPVGSSTFYPKIQFTRHPPLNYEIVMHRHRPVELKTPSEHPEDAQQTLRFRQSIHFGNVLGLR